MKTVLIYEKKSKLIKAIVSALFLTVCSLFILYLGLSDDLLSYTLLGGVGSLFCIYADIYLVGRGFKAMGSDKPEVIVKIDSEGVHDYSNKAAMGLVKWEEIKSVKIKKVFLQKFVSIELIDEQAYYEAHSKSPRFRRMINRGFSSSPINITLDMSETKVTELLQIIEARMPSLKNK